MAGVVQEGQAETHAAHIRVHAVGKLNELIEALALFRCGADDLIAENRARNAAAARGERAVLDCHVVVGNHNLGVDVVHLAHFAGHTELAAVTRVVLDHEQNASSGIDGLGGLIDGVSRRSGENGTCAGRVHHALADIEDLIGLMAGTGASDHCDLTGRLPLFAEDDALFGDDVQRVGICRDEAGQHLIDYIFRCVDNLFHTVPPFVILFYSATYAATAFAKT